MYMYICQIYKQNGISYCLLSAALHNNGSRVVTGRQLNKLLGFPCCLPGAGIDLYSIDGRVGVAGPIQSAVY